MTGHAALDTQGSESVITVDTSDAPFGMLTIAPSFRLVTTEEREQILNIYINRVYSASGWSQHKEKYCFCLRILHQSHLLYINVLFRSCKHLL